MKLNIQITQRTSGEHQAYATARDSLGRTWDYGFVSNKPIHRVEAERQLRPAFDNVVKQGKAYFL